MTRLTLIFVLCGAAALAGCVAPGTPSMRQSAVDGEGSLILGCQNVSGKTRVESYISNSYLTTWGSSYKEGANQGLQQALDDPTLAIGGTLLQQLVSSLASEHAAGAMRLENSRPSYWREKTNSLASSPQPFCRRYAAKFAAVSRAAAATVRQMDFRPRVVDERFGVFETEFVERRHAAARWRDRYVIVVEPEGPDNTVVMVFRIVYIARSDNVFNQGVSVGHNETWIMTRVADQLQ